MKGPTRVTLDTAGGTAYYIEILVNAGGGVRMASVPTMLARSQMYGLELRKE